MSDKARLINLTARWENIAANMLIVSKNSRNFVIELPFVRCLMIHYRSLNMILTIVLPCLGVIY